MTLILNLAVAVAIPLLLVYWIYRLVRRGYEMKALVENGVPAAGRVTRKLHFRGPAHRGARKRIVYEFIGPDGATHEGRFIASDGEFDEADVGRQIEIVCLPDRPRVNATRAMVEMCRPPAARGGA